MSATPNYPQNIDKNRNTDIFLVIDSQVIELRQFLDMLFTHECLSKSTQIDPVNPQLNFKTDQLQLKHFRKFKQKIYFALNYV